MLGSLAQTILVITDTAFLGRVGEIELGAVAIGGVFYFVLAMLGMALSVGTQIIIARRCGEGKTDDLGNVFDHSFILFVMLGVLLCCILYGLAPLMFHLTIQSEQIVQAVSEYMQYRSWGIVFVLLVNCFRGFFVGIAFTRVITYSSVIMTVSNIVLDYLLIFGKFGFPRMGIGGAGLASAIAEVLAVLYLFIYTASHRQLKTYNLFRFHHLKLEMFSKIINLSFPIMLQNLVSMAGWFIFFLFIEKMGEEQLAVSNIIRSTYMIMMTPMWGFSAAANSMVSNLIGQQKQDDVFRLLKKILRLSILFTSLIALYCLAFPEQILSITTSDQHLVRQSLGSFYVVCATIFVFSISIVLFSAVSGTGNTRIAMWMEFINIVIYLFYVYACVMLLQVTIEWVWGAEILYWILMGIFSVIYLKTGHWKKIKI